LIVRVQTVDASMASSAGRRLIRGAGTSPVNTLDRHCYYTYYYHYYDRPGTTTFWSTRWTARRS